MQSSKFRVGQIIFELAPDAQGVQSSPRVLGPPAVGAEDDPFREVEFRLEGDEYIKRVSFNLERPDNWSSDDLLQSMQIVTSKDRRSPVFGKQLSARAQFFNYHETAAKSRLVNGQTECECALTTYANLCCVSDCIGSRVFVCLFHRVRVSQCHRWPASFLRQVRVQRH